MTAMATVEFWDTFHSRGHTEWYLPLDIVVREALKVYEELKRLPPPRSKLDESGSSRGYPRILHPGCGSSTVGVVLHREHGCDVVNTDFSEGIMDTMRDLHPGCEFVRSDARNSEFPDGSFDLAVDKGLFDSITASTEGREEAAKGLLAEAARVLSPGGKYMLFSAFGNDGLGHKDMTEMLAHSGFGGQTQILELDTPPYEYPDQSSSYLYILTKAGSGGSLSGDDGRAEHVAADDSDKDSDDSGTAPRL